MPASKMFSLTTSRRNTPLPLYIRAGGGRRHLDGGSTEPVRDFCFRFTQLRSANVFKISNPSTGFVIFYWFYGVLNIIVAHLFLYFFFCCQKNILINCASLICECLKRGAPSNHPSGRSPTLRFQFIEFMHI